MVGRGHMASAGARAYDGCMGWSPEAEPPVKGRGQSPIPSLIKVKAFELVKKITNLPPSLYFANSV